MTHAYFYCNLCEKTVSREEAEMNYHATTKAVVFSHKDNHLLEVRAEEETSELAQLYKEVEAFKTDDMAMVSVAVVIRNATLDEVLTLIKKRMG